jgi:signal transduction histidine kinase
MNDFEFADGDQNSDVRLSHRLALLHLAGIAFLILVVVASIFWVSAEHNRLAKSASQRLVSGGINSILGQVETLVRDYSVWDEAYQATIEGDVPWLYSNIGNAVTEIGTLDLIVIIDPVKKTTLGWVETSPENGQVDLLPPEVTENLMDMLNRAVPPRRARAVIARIGDDFWALSIARIRPVSGLTSEVLREEAPRQVHGLRLSQQRLDRLAQSLLIENGIVISDSPSRGQASLPLRNSNEEILGHLVWKAPLPGAGILSRLALPLSVALGFAAIIAFFSAGVAVRSAQRLERALDAAKEADRMKSEFLSNVTHELRTPMNGVLGVAQLLRLTKLDAEQSELVDVLEVSASAQMALIADLLDFTCLESGHRTLTLEPFAPSRILGEIGDMIRATAASKGLTFETDWRPLEGLTLIGDVRAFRQIVTNLVGNAVKFTSEGKVAVGARVTQRDDQAQIVVSVSDTGVGIPAQELDRIFDRFYRIDESLTRSTDGAGLGLTISKRLAALLGGCIDVESEVGCGTTFRLSADFALAQNVAEDLRAA